MKIPLIFFAILWLAFNPVVNHAKARKDVELAFKRFITAFNNLDWDEFRMALADEVTVFNPDIPEAPSIGRLNGRQQVKEGFKSVFEASRKQASGPPYLHLVPKEVRIQVYGDTALVTFEFDRAGNSLGRRTLVFHRQGHAWKIVHIHASNVTRRS
ncbi:MAG: nuclear transport factor 2 family protein [Acidobacteria bacterium]|nr:nuclear transport factor 2 family protein [Acidobacteriota bacterium]